MIDRWVLLESEIVYESSFISLYKEKLKRPDGKIVDNFYSVKRRDAAYIVALTKDNKVPLVHQYKNGVKDVIWEVPAGFVEVNEKPPEAAKRELLEETGYIGDLIFLGKFVTNTGVLDSRSFLFLAEKATKTSEQKLDHNENIEVEIFDLDQLVKDIKNRQSIFVDTQSQLSLLLVWEYLKQ